MIELQALENEQNKAVAIPALLEPPAKSRKSSARRSLRRQTRVSWVAEDFDPLLRVQYYEALTSARVPSGEMKLLYAILEDAVRCYVMGKSRPSASDHAEFFEAHEWFSLDDRTHVFSFQSVCTLLDINPACVRKKLNCLERADIPLQRFCNRRRLSERKRRIPRLHHEYASHSQIAEVRSTPSSGAT
jgi:hypothetical protein